MDSTDIKAYGEAHKKIWADVIIKADNGRLPLMAVEEAMLETWKAAKEHYEKEYSVPKAEWTGTHFNMNVLRKL